MGVTCHGGNGVDDGNDERVSEAVGSGKVIRTERSWPNTHSCPNRFTALLTLTTFSHLQSFLLSLLSYPEPPQPFRWSPEQLLQLPQDPHDFDRLRLDVASRVPGWNRDMI